MSFLGLTLIPVLFVLFSDWVPWVKGVVSFGIAIIFFFSFYWNNIINLEDVYIGVPKVFGKRHSKWLLEEGNHWLPPKPFMDFLPIYIGQQNINLGHQVITKKEIVLVNVEAAIYWQVIDPFKMTTAKRIISELDNTGFTKSIQGKLRSFAAENEYDTKSLLTAGSQYEEGVSRTINEFVQSSKEDWGIQVLDVVMTKIVTINQDTMNKFEKILQDSLKRENQMIDARTLADRIKILMDKAGIPGEVAAEFVLGLRGVLQRKESIFMGEIPGMHKR
ncbi:MAG: hypothetical protein IPJ54_16855 [Saprospiraceae bacterium]|nr:hypothetical protein [Saprospiraceae bacterium]